VSREGFGEGLREPYPMWRTRPFTTF
jgi:hypothetical protein